MHNGQVPCHLPQRATVEEDSQTQTQTHTHTHTQYEQSSIDPFKNRSSKNFSEERGKNTSYVALHCSRLAAVVKYPGLFLTLVGLV